MLVPIKNYTLTPLKIIPSVTFTNFAFAVGLCNWSQIAPLLKKFLKKERVSQILLLPLPCLSGLIHILICNTKIGKKSDVAKS